MLKGEKPNYPIIKQGSYLLVYLQELGYANTSGGQFSPITYQTIESYLNLSELKLTFTEIKILIALSTSFENTFYESKDKDYKAPYII